MSIELKFKDGRKLDVEYPIKLKDSHGNITYNENSDGHWAKYEFDANGNITYLENSNCFWAKYEYDDDNNLTYLENSDGSMKGTSKHNVVEMTMEEVCKAIGKNVKVIK